jgi:hypothetical protein
MIFVSCDVHMTFQILGNPFPSRQQSDLLSSLQDMMDSRLSAFQQNIQQISTTQISKIEDNLNYITLRFQEKGK